MFSSQDQRLSLSTSAEDRSVVVVRIEQHLRPLWLCLDGPGGRPVLTDASNSRFYPWQVELLHWPPSAETALREGGYGLSAPDFTSELWCNCAD